VTSDDRRTALGAELIEIHNWLRAELDRLRDDVDAYLDGGGDRPRELRTHCVAFCAAVTRHHTDEDDGVFPALAARFPELTPALDELGRDHRIVTGMMRSLQALLDRIDEVSPVETRAELDGLAALLESHFTYEERKLVTALDSLA
jgi:hemerythrin-like domain-containing protein